MPDNSESSSIRIDFAPEVFMNLTPEEEENWLKRIGLNWRSITSSVK